MSIDAAMRYTGLGLRVIPLHNATRWPLGEEPSRSEKLIREWWPGCGVGIATGRGLIGVVVAQERDGAASWAKIMGGPPPSTAVALGEGGRLTYLFHLDPRRKVWCTEEVLPGIAILGNGGWIDVGPEPSDVGWPSPWVYGPEQGIAESPAGLLAILEELDPEKEPEGGEERAIMPTSLPRSASHHVEQARNGRPTPGPSSDIEIEGRGRVAGKRSRLRKKLEKRDSTGSERRAAQGFVRFSIGWGLHDPEVLARLRELYCWEELNKVSDGEVKVIHRPFPLNPPGFGTSWCDAFKHTLSRHRAALAKALGTSDPDDLRWTSYAVSYRALVGCARNLKHENLKYVYVALDNAHKAFLRESRDLAEPLDQLVVTCSHRPQDFDLAIDLDEAIRDLPLDQAHAVRGHLLEERSFEELGREVGRDKSTVQRRYEKGLEKVRRRLRDYEPSGSAEGVAEAA